MKKRVKGKIEKHYCDKCRKLLYEHIPQKPQFKILGQWIPEFREKRYCAFVREWGEGEEGTIVAIKEYCKECHEKIYSK